MDLSFNFFFACVEKEAAWLLVLKPFDRIRYQSLPLTFALMTSAEIPFLLNSDNLASASARRLKEAKLITQLPFTILLFFFVAKT